MRFRILAPSLLAIALSTTTALAEPTIPARTDDGKTSALATSRAGLYTLTLVGDAGQQAVDLAIEPAKAGFSALLITPGHESWLSDVKFDGKRLTGTTLTSAGRGTLMLEMTDTGARGHLVVAGRAISVIGTRER
ncbi:MAG: hypothetical protein HOQ30_03170 [Gemmatimonadaceae bacterium]|nr:hypothetical protein [Gemmatimonadaceae bacterium]